VNQNNPPRWQVSSVQETTQPGAAGQITRGVRVSYTMANGTTGSVFVPANEYKPDIVKDRVEQAVRSHEAVQQLRG
jgi:hypothetical protein